MSRGATGTVTITGRFGNRPDLDLGHRERAPLSFSDRLILHYPGSEAVLEAELHPKSDPYLADYTLLGKRLFPGVMGVEAMAEAAGLVSPQTPWRLADLEFHGVVAVPETGEGIRIAAQRSGGSEIVETGIFCETDAFLKPRVKARFLPAAGPEEQRRLTEAYPAPAFAAMPLLYDLAPLYGPLFFQGERFARLAVLNDLTSRRVDVTVNPAAGDGWFGDQAQQALVLGDPSVSDCALHMVQLAVLNRRILPVRIGAVDILGDPARTRRLVATENWAREERYSFDIAAYDADGVLTAVLRDARFRAVAVIDADAVMAAAPALAETLLERTARAELDDGLRLALVRDDGLDADQRRAAAMNRLELSERALARPGQAPRRATRGGIGVSHTARSTLAILSDTPVSCDLVDLELALPEGFAADRFSEVELRSRLSRNSAAPSDGTPAPDIEISRRVIAPLGLAAAIGVRHDPQEAGPTLQ